jgi:glyoxylase-like metal-dependent hydrolase (beta-lactamase superfamily II)
MENKIVTSLAAVTTSNLEITPEILILQFTVVNAFMIGKPHKEWVLIDTGLENSAEHIFNTAEERYGKDNKPQAIILTHSHFDHIGSLIKLLEKWDVPVYIHNLERPYIMGQLDYPEPDPDVSNGLIAKMSPTFPHTSIDIGDKAKPLPNDGTIPYMPDWVWLHTPGHSDGHVSLFNEIDRTLIVGDAFCTVKQESLLSVITQDKNISGPPKYLTTDWEAAANSVNLLQKLKPKLILPSHGKPLNEEESTKFLDELANNFQSIAVPKEGKFVE